MVNSRHIPISRRAFLQEASAVGSGAILASNAVIGRASAAEAPDTLARRVLGRTKQEVTALALGTAPCGQSRSVDTPTIMAIVAEALEQGINFIDTARIYGNAEEAIGKALVGRRDQVFLTTKVWADDADQARQSLDQSMQTLKTEQIDLVYLHSMGNRDPKRALAADGALTYLLQQKEAGKTRFVGISGHSRADSFVPVLETGTIDVVMMAMNFVDRHVYGFERKVLPVARQHDVGVVCMKVFGGIRGGFRNYGKPNPGAQMPSDLLSQAVRYAMGLPGVATLVIGPHTVEQLRENVQMVRRYQPLAEAEQAALAKLGQQLAAQWGPHYGPVS